MRRADGRTTKRPKVLHVLEAIEGGTSRHLRAVVRHVDAEHVVVVAPERIGGFTDTGAFDEFARVGAEVHLVPMRRSPLSRHNARALLRIRRLVQQHRPDIVHGHSAIGGALARLASVGGARGRVYTPNGLYPARTAMAVERALGVITDVLIASSDSEQRLVERLRLVPRDRVVMIPNAIELDPPPPSSIDVRAKLGVAKDTLVVGSVARLERAKAPEVFVRACALVAKRSPCTRFVLVGSGPLAEQVESEIDASALRGSLLLLQDRNDGPALMNQFDVHALSSRYEAGATFASMEAMRAGSPLVVTDVVGSRDTVEDGCSGLVVPPEDPTALAEAILRLLADPELRQRLAAAAEERLKARFDVSMAAERLGRLYRCLAGPSNGARATRSKRWRR